MKSVLQQWRLMGMALLMAAASWQCGRDDAPARRTASSNVAHVLSQLKSQEKAVFTITRTDSLPETIRRRWKRNPFQPVHRRALPADSATSHAAQAETLRFRLQGILWNQTQRMAIINNQMVLPGRRYEHFEVLEITPTFVRIRVFPEKQIVTLNWTG